MPTASLAAILGRITHRGASARAVGSFQPTLRQTIGLLLAGGIFLITAAIAWNSYRASRLALLSFARSTVQQHSQLFAEALKDFLQDVSETLSLSRDLLRSGTIPAEDPEALEAFLFSVLSAKPALSKIGFGGENGDFLMVARDAQTGALSTKRIRHHGGGREVLWRHRAPGGPLSPPLRVIRDDSDSFDPRVRPWYRGAIADTRPGGVFWTEVYVFHSDRQPGVTASTALRDRAGRLRGVLIVDLNLLDLSRFLRSTAMGHADTAFLLDANQGLVATSSREPPRPVEGAQGLRLRRLSESGQPDLAALASRLPAAGALRGDAPPLRFRVADRDYLATLMPLWGGQGEAKRWLLGVVLQEDALLQDARRAHYRNLAGAALSAVLGLLLGLLLARLISLTLGRLVNETERVRALEFAPSEVRERFREVREVLLAFEGMKAGLRAFQKYVPLSLVRTLLDAGSEPRLGGEVRELTVFFSDIRGFTTLSEGLRPQELAEKLGRYLSVVTEAIHQQRGTVDKYIGDGVMAFWGAPQPLLAHAEAACEAALACQAAIRALSGQHPDQPEFPTRIGLHTAEVLVGNFGSADRLNYTVLGDGVNVASRLEQLCGYFGVEILISERTQALVAARFATRRLGPVAIRGREQPLTVFELLGERDQVDAGRLARAQRYEEALRLFLGQRFAEAMQLLEAILARREDAAARRLMTAVELQVRRRAAGEVLSSWTPVL